MIDERRLELTVDGYWSIKNERGIKRFANRIWIPNMIDIKWDILSKSHESIYFIHSGSTKMYQDLNNNYRWPNMKREIADLISKCFIGQKVKIEHQRPSGLLQPLEIPEWK